jgi:hypothetical protein
MCTFHSDKKNSFKYEQDTECLILFEFNYQTFWVRIKYFFHGDFVLPCYSGSSQDAWDDILATQKFKNLYTKLINEIYKDHNKCELNNIVRQKINKRATDNVLPKQQIGINLTKAQKKEHSLWINLNEFRKQAYTLTLPQNVSDVLFKTNIYWRDEKIIWKSDEEEKQANILMDQGYKKMRKDAKEEAIEELRQEALDRGRKLGIYFIGVSNSV